MCVGGSAETFDAFLINFAVSLTTQIWIFSPCDDMFLSNERMKLISGAVNRFNRINLICPVANWNWLKLRVFYIVEWVSFRVFFIA